MSFVDPFSTSYSITSKAEQVVIRNRRTQTTQKARARPHSDNLFIANSNGCLTQWSITHQKITKDYGKLCKGEIWSMAVTPNNKSLFVSDWLGHVLQISIPDQTVIKDFGQLHQICIWSILTTHDS
jgi:hypothetical protein